MIGHVLGSRASIGGVLGSGRGGAAAAWYLAGGVSAANCVAAYQPIGAASLAASYINLANPGTFDAAPGVAPTFDTATGWTFDGSSQYLKLGIVGSACISFLMRFTDCVNLLASNGAAQTGPVRYTFIRPRTGTNRQIFLSAFDSFTKAGALTSGVFGWAGYSVYLDGASDGTVSGAPADSPAQIEMYIGALNFDSAPAQYSDMKVQAIAIYNVTLDAATVAAISAAMAAL